MALRWVWKGQKYLQRTELLAIVPAAFVLDHKDHSPSLPSIPDSNVGLQRCDHAGFLQNDGAGMLWNGEVQGIWTSPISFAREPLRLGSGKELLLVFWMRMMLIRAIQNNLRRVASILVGTTKDWYPLKLMDTL